MLCFSFKAPKTSKRYMFVFQYFNSNILNTSPAGNYMFKVNNRNTRTKVWNMFKVNNKATRTTWRRSGGFIINFEHISHLCSSVSIVKLKHVNAGWEGTEEAIVSYSGKKKFLKYRQLLWKITMEFMFW